MDEQKENQGASGSSWLDDRIARLDAVYRRFGREGLREYPLQDISLLLSAKELEYRDAPKGRDLSETQKAENRRLETGNPRPGQPRQCVPGRRQPSGTEISAWVQPRTRRLHRAGKVPATVSRQGPAAIAAAPSESQCGRGLPRSFYARSKTP